jgi:hypothetical protein
MRFGLFSFIFLVLIFGKTQAQDSLINRIFHLAYNQEYELADSLLQTNKSNIDVLYFAVLEMDMSYWKNVTGTHEPNYSAFEKTLLKYDSETAETLNQKGIQLIQLSYQLRYEMKRYKFINAAFTYNKTKIVFDELVDHSRWQEFDQPELIELYNNMFRYYENDWKPFKGKSRELKCQQALLNIESLTLSQNEIVNTMASYFLAKTYLKYEKQPQKGIPYFLKLTNLYPNNRMFLELLEECRNESKLE